MFVKDVLGGLKYDGLVSLRKKSKYGIEYIGGGTTPRVSYRFGYYTVVKTCIDEQILILYVE